MCCQHVPLLWLAKPELQSPRKRAVAIRDQVHSRMCCWNPAFAPRRLEAATLPWIHPQILWQRNRHLLHQTNYELTVPKKGSILRIPKKLFPFLIQNSEKKTPLHCRIAAFVSLTWQTLSLLDVSKARERPHFAVFPNGHFSGNLVSASKITVQRFSFDMMAMTKAIFYQTSSETFALLEKSTQNLHFPIWFQEWAVDKSIAIRSKHWFTWKAFDWHLGPHLHYFLRGWIFCQDSGSTSRRLSSCVLIGQDWISVLIPVRKELSW